MKLKDVDMEDMRTMETINVNTNLDKLGWTPPKLICLDKGKTEGGPFDTNTEDHSYAPGPS